MRKWELLTELVHDDEWQRSSQDHVREGEVEDEDVPGCPHILLPHYSEKYEHVAKN